MPSLASSDLPGFAMTTGRPTHNGVVYADFESLISPQRGLRHWISTISCDRQRNNSMLHTFMFTKASWCLPIAVISLTAFSHKIFKHRTIEQLWRKIFHVKISIFSVDVRIRSHSSYLASFIDIIIRLKSTAYFFDPPCIWVYDLQRQKNDVTDRKVEKIAIAGTSRRILTALNTTQM